MIQEDKNRKDKDYDEERQLKEMTSTNDFHNLYSRKRLLLEESIFLRFFPVPLIAYYYERD